jgi:glutaredoxin
MKIEAYTLPGCSSCRSLKKLFERADVAYTEYVLHRDMKVSEFKEKYSHITVFPFVVIDEDEIGGLVETVKLFLEKGLVSSGRK